MSLAAKGAVPPDAAFALVFGANLRHSNQSAAGDCRWKRCHRKACAGWQYGHPPDRCRVGNGDAAKARPWLVVTEPDPARAVADLHLGFNLLVAALFLPVLPYYAALLRRLFPARIEAPDPSRPIYLDEAAHETPIVAIGAAAGEALRLADVQEAMLLAARAAFSTDDRRRVADARRMDDGLDRLNYAIKTYLTGLDAGATSGTDQRRIEEILAFTINLEHAGDVVDKNLLETTPPSD
jgi:phosphate:Na+ symporter